MKKKPVAQAWRWAEIKLSQAVYGLLSLCVTAIVVDYFIPVSLRALATGQRDARRVYTFID
ncbi:acid stress response protein YqgB [Kosakonia arachidis]|uniref:acid stress response protein YqgB n=1 Tax=Kosakonia arachidis TaxID=551989 RepID=UPI001114117E